MIGPGTGARAYLACGVTDTREAIGGLATLAQQVLDQNPASDADFLFRGRRGDRLLLLRWGGQGLCLDCNAVEQGLSVPSGDRLESLLAFAGHLLLKPWYD